MERRLRICRGFVAAHLWVKLAGGLTLFITRIQRTAEFLLKKIAESALTRPLPVRQPEWTGGSTDETSKIGNRFSEFFPTCRPTTAPHQGISCRF